MKALLKIEWLLTKRNWIVFILGIGMPVLFFLLFSSMFDESYGDVMVLTRNYLLTMTGFSMSSFGLFSFPTILEEDKKSGWLLHIQHSPISLPVYYSVKVIRILLSFLLSIIINFAVGYFFRDVTMTASQWLLSAVFLLLTSTVYLAIGLLLTNIISQQIMVLLSNILYFVLAIFGGSWMPYETLPDWMKTIAHFTPSYHANQVILMFINKNTLQIHSLLIVLFYTIMIAGIALLLKKKQEVA